MGTFPYVVRMTKNNGIRGYIKEDEIYLNDANTLSFAQDTFTVYYQKEKYFTGNKVKVLKPKFNNPTENCMQFITASFYKALKLLTWGTGSDVEMINNIVVSLPTKNEKIDFEFMESFVAELEAQRVAELEAYLIASGLDDYELTLDEINLLNWFDKIEWKEYRVDELFEICSYKKRFDANKVNIMEKGTHPYVVRMSGNNGQKGYIDENPIYLNEGNTVSFGQDTATMFYQEVPYFTGDKIKILKPKNVKFNKINAQFILSALRRTFSLFSWGGSSFNVDIISEQLVKLPIKNDEINFEFMEMMIKIIQKLVVKDVVDYTNIKIEKTKQVINKK